MRVDLHIVSACATDFLLVGLVAWVVWMEGSVTQVFLNLVLDGDGHLHKLLSPTPVAIMRLGGPQRWSYV